MWLTVLTCFLKDAGFFTKKPKKHILVFKAMIACRGHSTAPWLLEICLGQWCFTPNWGSLCLFSVKSHMKNDTPVTNCYQWICVLKAAGEGWARDVCSGFRGEPCGWVISCFKGTAWARAWLHFNRVCWRNYFFPLSELLLPSPAADRCCLPFPLLVAAL